MLTKKKNVDGSFPLVRLILRPQVSFALLIRQYLLLVVARILFRGLRTSILVLAPR